MLDVFSCCKGTLCNKLLKRQNVRTSKKVVNASFCPKYARSKRPDQLKHEAPAGLDIEQYITVIKMSFAGKYKYQHRHKNTDNYEEYLKLMCVPWLQRKLEPLLCPRLTISTDLTGGTLRFCSDYCPEKVIVLGEEHTETLPGGEKATAVTVREGDNCLITRLKSPWNMELRREFSSKGMLQQIRHPESGLEASRFFKRCG